MGATVVPGLDVRGISRSFAGRAVLHDVSFTAAPGAIVGFLGVNGAGKTTLFRILSGFECPDAGSMALDGRSLRFSSPSTLCRQGVAATFQKPLAIPDNSVEELLRLAQSVRSRSPISKILNDVIVMLVPRDLWSRPLVTLDGAMLRRVDFARALATCPRVVLLDEVFATQDRSGVAVRAESIARAQSSGIAFVVADHVPDVLLRVCNELHVLSEGRLVCSGSPAAVVEAAVTRRYYFDTPTHGSSR